MAKLMLLLLALYGSAHARDIPFWDHLANADFGMQIYNMQFEPCDTIPCEIHSEVKTRFSFKFLSRGNYSLSDAQLHFEATEVNTGEKVYANYALSGDLSIISGDDDGLILTLNSGGLYDYVDPYYDYNLIPSGLYIDNVKVRVGTNHEIIGDFDFIFKILNSSK